MLRGKRILLGVTGSIAAYKSAFLVREFIKAGAEVQVVLTDAASSFVTPLTLGTLSKRPVLNNFVKEPLHAGVWNNHVELGLWADLMVVAPASANTLAKMAHGEADNLLLTTYLSAKCTVYFAPAMDLDMHAHGANKSNIDTLVERGNIHIPSGSGELASGLKGQGRMAEPEEIRAFIEQDLKGKAPLFGKEVLITAGPTQEPIDPVRYIGNRSTGKMGYAIAEAALAMGAEVNLVSGPVSLDPPKGVNLIRVQTAQEMFEATTPLFESCDVAILSAAVADYRSRAVADHKLKKSADLLTIDLEPTPDILKTLGDKKSSQVLVGFALETNDALANAKGKLEHKKCDLIVLNTLADEKAGFGFDTNKVTFVSGNKIEESELKSKREIAVDLLHFIKEHFL
ncbi:bifunctional phosphopantothenoylcysteine decarboxylase/phosphopantothenate--cysteine ligase CoaBC [Cryomorphaceae bacterium 1068]|nr:bifunctional phosphopantothenoylcysteine decarboxylase/phosphopantothenate--cysteine ligase CoaBC [Cryomorphaceae bacterium 1068]